jgi:endo-alpha-1,4-polygalactosaminidase (GH114 family)
LNLFELIDVSQFGLPNEKRNRTEIESTAELIDVLKTDYPGYTLRVITENGNEITDYKKAIAYIASWEREQIADQNEQTENLAYLKITYRPAIDIVNKVLTIDLEDPDRFDLDSMGS